MFADYAEARRIDSDLAILIDNSSYRKFKLKQICIIQFNLNMILDNAQHYV